MMHDVTVILCTYNRAELLPEALASLSKLRTDDQFTYDVLVVDNASTDDTQDVVTRISAASETPIRCVREAKPGLSAARNCGIAEATSEWLAFFDDDERADSRWLLELWSHAHTKRARAVGGAVRLVSDDDNRNLSPAIGRLLAPGGRGRQAARFTATNGLNGGNQMLHRGVFDDIGGYDESWEAGGEDTEFFMRLQTAGIDAWYTPLAIVNHLVPEYRLSSEYLRWMSLRQGWSTARKDVELRGLSRGVMCAAQRAARAAVTATQLAVAWTLRRRDGVLLRHCQLCRTAGYTRHVLKQLAPRWLGQQRFEEWIEFRGERKEFA